MSILSNQVPPPERNDSGEQDHDKETNTQDTINRLAAAEHCLRITLEHSINPPIEFDLSVEETQSLRGRTLSETIETLCERVDPYVADSIRQTLTDPAALVEVSRNPTRPGEKIDRYLEQGEMSLGVSRSMRGGATQ